MTTLPILPGLIQPGPIQAGLPTAPADTTADPNGACAFLDQLAAALASLAPSQASAPEVAVPLDEAPDEGDTDNQSSEQSDQTDQTMVDLAASFGLVPMPLPMPLAVMNVTTDPTTGDLADAAAQPGPQTMALVGQVATSAALLSSTPDALSTTAESQAHGPSPLAEPLPGDQALSSSVSADVPAPNNPAQPALDVAPAPVLPQPDTQLSRVPTPALATSAADASAGAAGQPVREAVTDNQPHRAADNTRADVAPTPGTRSARLSGDDHEPSQARQPGTMTTTTPAAHSQIVQQPATGSETHAGGDRHGHEHTAQHDSTPATPEPTSADQSVQATRTPLAAVAGVAPPNAPSAANAAHPREVVAQIAHQAELYRLPGGRGVRIQLHPDGLGGVEVTLRYGAAGGLELHVNVEHAATGSLVQAGWSELRDALAQQGISPDRLVMSVSGPDGASLSSDSGSFASRTGASFSQDAGPSGFGQSASQGQHERQPAPGRARWTPSVNPTSHEPDIVAPASSSRIDLRV